MALTLVWTKRAIQGYDKIVRYLEHNWTEKEISPSKSPHKRHSALAVSSMKCFMKTERNPHPWKHSYEVHGMIQQVA